MTLSLLRVSLVLIFLLSIPASAARFEANGTTYYQNYDGTYTTTPAIISSSPLGYQVDWAGVRYFKVWDDTNKLLYDTINYNNGTFISPWIAPHLNYWRTTGGGSWREVIAVSNTFEQQGNNIISRTKYADGEWLNTTTSFGKKIKYSWELNASQNRNYSLVFRIDSAARQDMNADTKKYTPGFLNNFTYYDWSDYGNNNVSTWLDTNNRKFYQRFVLGTLQVGQKVSIDPVFETNGSTTPAWQNTSYDNMSFDSNDWSKAIVLNYTNSTTIKYNGSVLPGSDGWTKVNSGTPGEGVSNGIFNMTSKINDVEYYRRTGVFSSGAQGLRWDTRFKINSVPYTGSAYYGFTFWIEDTINNKRAAPSFHNDTINDVLNGITPVVISPLNNSYHDVVVLYNKTAITILIDGSRATSYTITSTASTERILWGDPSSSTLASDNVDVDVDFVNYHYNETQLTVYKEIGNSTHWHDFGSGRQGANVMFNFTNATGLFVDAYASTDNFTSSNVLVASNITNATWVAIPAAAKNQTQYVRAVLKGNTTSTPELMAVSIEDEASGAPPADSGAIPPNITVLAQTNSSTGYWINYTWQNGTENTNITNSFNVSVNSTWTNGSITNFSNGTVNPHGWRNISVWAFNSSGNGNLSNASVSMNTQIPNNVPVQSGIGAKSVDEGSWLNFSISSTDLDGDDLTYATNATKGTLTTKNFNWSTTYSDSGTYYWIFNTTDNYSAVATETVTITVNNVNQLPPTPVINSIITGNFYINTTWTAGSGNVTNGYNSTNGTTWVNNTLTYRNTTLSAHGWQNLTIYAWNSTDNTLSSALTNNTQIPNNAISISGVSSSYSINEGQTLNIDADYTDTDGDTGTFDDNATQWSVNSGTGIMSWTTGYSDAGTYNWLINVTDGYGSTSTTTFVVTVTDVPQEFMPPTPIIGTVTTGNFFKNLTWTAGVGNVTNTYNVSRNGTWFNGTATFLNTTTVAHGWINDTIYAFNSSGTGTLNTTGVTNNTQVPNNVPIQLSIGDKSVNEGTLLSFTISSTDSDGDALTYGSNNSKGILTDNSFSWTPTYSDSGTYTWYFNTTDNYSAVATETITITVNNVNQIPPVPVINTVTNGTSWVNQSWTAGVGNVTDSYNVSVNGTWTNGTTTTYKNTTGISANGWANLTVWAWNNTDNTLSSTALTNNTQTTSTSSSSSFIPPVPVINSTHTGNFYINTSWTAGTGNVTDSYNSTNGTTWVNNTATSRNTTLSAHAWQNLTIYAYNNTYGNLSLTALTNNTQIPNNLPVITNASNKNVNENTTIYVDIDATDADSDTLIFSTNGTNFTDFDSTTGKGNWTANFTSAGTYYIDFGIGDGYGVSNTTMTITITNIPLSITSQTPTTPVTTTNGTSQTFTAETNRSANYTWTINSTTVQTNTTVSTASYINSTAGVGNYNVTVSITDGIDTTSYTWDWNVTSIPTYSINGYTFDNNLAVLQGVLVQNGTNQSTSNSLGYYSITGMGNGTYNFTFSKTGFDTTYSDITVNGASLTNQNKTIYDNSSPTQVTGLANGTVTASKINISWNPSTDANLWGYRIYRNDTTIANTTSLYYNDTGLIANTLYQYIIRANDTYNNWGLNSTTLNVNTSNLEYNMSGYVFDNNNAALNAVSVTNGSFTTTTNSSGYYKLTGITNGTRNFSYTKTGFNTGYIEVNISGADNTTANITILNTLPPASISGISSSETTTTITWSWTNPSDSDFNYTSVYLDGVFKTNSSSASYADSGLSSSTSYTLATKTVDIYGNINTTWTNNTAQTNAVTSTGKSGGNSIIPYTPSETPSPTTTPTTTPTPEIYEKFIPTLSPYQVQHPLDIGIYSIQFKSSCVNPVFLNRTGDNIFVISQCVPDSFRINFIVPKSKEVSQLINGTWVKSEQQIVAVTTDRTYYIVQVTLKSFGIFTFTEKSIISTIHEQSFKDTVLYIDRVMYDKLMFISQSMSDPDNMRNIDKSLYNNMINNIRSGSLRFQNTLANATIDIKSIDNRLYNNLINITADTMINVKSFDVVLYNNLLNKTEEIKLVVVS